jgi:flagellar basal-body rod protein FlgB
MTYTTPTLQLLAHATELSAMRQSVYAANIANAGVEGYRRLEVAFDREVERFALAIAGGGNGDSTLAPLPVSASSWLGPQTATVVQTDATVQLDQEMALMAQNALRYQTLIGAFERTMQMMRSAIFEGRQ